MNPEHLGDSRMVLFDLVSPSMRVGVASLDTGEWNVLLEGAFPKFSPTGHLVVWRPSSLWTVPFDAAAGEVAGEPAPLLADISYPGLYGTYDVSDDGTLVVAPFRGNRLLWVDRAGRELGSFERVGFAGHPGISPDGSRVALRELENATWVEDLQRGTRHRVVAEGTTGVPVWAPDGERIAYTIGGETGIYLQRSDGTGERELLLEHDGFPEPSAWSPDGRWLAFHESSLSGKKSDVWVLSMAGTPAVRTFVGTGANEQAAAFSPNGRFIAYVSDESGRNEIYVQAFPDSGRRWTLSVGGGAGPIWSHDGRELFYARGTEIWAVPVETEREFTADVPTQLFDGPYGLEGGHPHYDVSPDGRFLVNRLSFSAPTFTVIVDWPEILKHPATE